MFAFLLVPVVAVNISMSPCPVQAPDRTWQSSCYMVETQTIHLAPAEWKQKWGRRWILAHELGHAYDHQALTDGNREWLQAGPWREERFANDYADCATAAPERNRRVCRWLWARSPYRMLRSALRR